MTTTIEASPKGMAIDLRVTTDRPGTEGITIWKRIGTKPITTVRGVSNYLDHGGFLNVLDYDIEYNVPISYSAEVGPELSLMVTAEVKSDGAWLRNVLYPQNSMPLCLVEHDEVSRNARTALLRAVKTTHPIAVTDVREASAGTSRFTTVTDAERVKFLGLVNSGDVLMLTGPASWDLGPLYLVLLDVKEQRPGRIYRDERVWVCNWTEVKPPAVPLLGVGQTWADFQSSVTRWGAALDRTWIDVQYPPPNPAVLRSSPPAVQGFRA